MLAIGVVHSKHKRFYIIDVSVSSLTSALMSWKFVAMNRICENFHRGITWNPEILCSNHNFD